MLNWGNKVFIVNDNKLVQLCSCIYSELSEVISTKGYMTLHEFIQVTHQINIFIQRFLHNEVLAVETACWMKLLQPLLLDLLRLNWMIIGD